MTEDSTALTRRKSALKIINTHLDDYSDLTFSPEEEAKLHKHLQRASMGSTGYSPMMCAGQACPFAARCPLVQMRPEGDPIHGKAPINKLCLLETTALRDYTVQYIEEYEVDPSNFTEVGIVQEMAEIEILQWRINMQLASSTNAGLIIEQPVGVSESGRVITRQEISPLFDAKNKLSSRKQKLIKLMVGDRQEKYKKEAALKTAPETDASTKMSAMKKQLKELQSKLALALNKPTPGSPEVLDAEYKSAEDLINEEG